MLEFEILASVPPLQMKLIMGRPFSIFLTHEILAFDQ